ncbi:uncharacterized protein LOC142331050 [Lycorma delicatula]|uniref:uncharacterized protein LOC142331050 n=1 Tax=Lycorma delicatula TaxID=130591 RepID=UPI003F50DEFE
MELFKVLSIHITICHVLVISSIINENFEVDCVKECINVYAPVCSIGVNGDVKTFPNTCFMHQEKCKSGKLFWKLADGECAVPPSGIP